MKLMKISQLFCTHSVKPVVNKMLDVLAHADLSHEFVLIAVHASQLPNMSKDVLQTISQLEHIHTAQSVLHMTVNHKLHET